jgi:hypothetical protein
MQIQEKSGHYLRGPSPLRQGDIFLFWYIFPDEVIGMIDGGCFPDNKQDRDNNDGFECCREAVSDYCILLI